MTPDTRRTEGTQELSAPRLPPPRSLWTAKQQTRTHTHDSVISIKGTPIKSPTATHALGLQYRQAQRQGRPRAATWPLQLSFAPADACRVQRRPNPGPSSHREPPGDAHPASGGLAARRGRGEPRGGVGEWGPPEPPSQRGPQRVHRA